MRQCTKCEVVKPENDFNWKNKGKGRRQSRCRDCTTRVLKTHYHQNKTTYLKKAKAWTKDQRNRLKSIVYQHLSSRCCVDCGETDIVVLDFDHLNHKRNSVSVMMRRGVSIETIQKEIAKCQIRCANCHRRKTAKDQNWQKQFEDNWPHITSD